MQAILKRFAKENSKFDMKEDMMGEMLGDTLEGEDEEEETSEIVGSILDELGIDVLGEVGVGHGTLKMSVEEKEELSLEERLARLRGGSE